MGRKRKKRLAFFIKVIFVSVLLIGASTFAVLYNSVYASNVEMKGGDPEYLYIKSGSEFSDVMDQIKQQNLVVNMTSFEWTAELMNYPAHIYPGKYKIEQGMSNRQLLTKLRSGQQEQVKIMFGKTRGKRQLAKYFSDRLEVDFDSLYSMITDPDYQKKYGMNSRTISAMFIPNTYFFDWNTSAKQVLDRMIAEYNNFWTKSRIKKAQKLQLSKVEVITLASIVEEETYRNDEKSKIAGVYLNRLRKGRRLEADPTVRFAVGDFTLKRVLREHLKIKSPYNTYRVKGLPPGPICIPSIKSIDAVLSPSQHNYFFFCADAEFTGYHHFSETFDEHRKYARAYQKNLTKQIAISKEKAPY